MLLAPAMVARHSTELEWVPTLSQQAAGTARAVLSWGGFVFMKSLLRKGQNF